MIDNGAWWDFYDCDDDGQPQERRYEMTVQQHGGFYEQKVCSWPATFVDAMDTVERMSAAGYRVFRVWDITDQDLMPGMRPLGRVEITDEVRQAVAERATR